MGPAGKLLRMNLLRRDYRYMVVRCVVVVVFLGIIYQLIDFDESTIDYL